MLEVHDISSLNVVRATDYTNQFKQVTKLSKAHIDGTLLLLAFNQSLRQAVSNSFVDFSTLQVILRWMAQVRDNIPNFWSTIEMHMRALEDTVALKSGLSLMEIWSSLAFGGAPSNFEQEIASLEGIAHDTIDTGNVIPLKG